MKIGISCAHQRNCSRYALHQSYDEARTCRHFHKKRCERRSDYLLLKFTHLFRFLLRISTVTIRTHGDHILQRILLRRKYGKLQQIGMSIVPSVFCRYGAEEMKLTMKRETSETKKFSFFVVYWSSRDNAQKLLPVVPKMSVCFIPP